MDEQKTNTLQYQPTRLIDNNPGGWWTNVREILELFWNSPANIVREKCLQTLEAMDGIGSADLRWLEERIPIVFSSDRQLDYGERLLSLCLFKSYIRVDRERTLELAITLFLKTVRGMGDVGFFSGPRARKLSKMIAGVIRKYPEYYWAPSVPDFLEASLACLHDDGTIRERTLKLICAANDTSFLARISDLGRRAEESRNKAEDYKMTDDFEERFAAAKARSVLQETVRHLLVCKTEEGSDIIDFQIAVAQALRKIGALNFLPMVTLNCPEKIFDSEANFTFSVKVEHEMEGNPFSESGPIEAVLNSCRLVVTVDGSNFEGGERHQEADFSERSVCVHPPYLVTNKAHVGKMEGTARRTIRVRVIIWHTTKNKDDKPCLEHIAAITRYLHRAE